MKNKHRWVYLLIYLLIASVLLTGVSFSRFATTLANTGAEDATEVPDIDFSTWVLEQNASAVSLEGMAPGDSRSIDITISNWKTQADGDKVSDYSQSVTLSLTTTGNLPLAFILTTAGGSPVSLRHPTAGLYESDAQAFTAGVKETKQYTLTVSWPAGVNDVRYKDEIDHLELRLKAVQS
ncbi:hypothetical protein SAMN02745823_02221 [Sporobacter termitidis DSM 10068]|uniref:SipW-cognate class signal peptide n=1 Tax=Sporobacter termitidis DSM 10068 TaxID=1123282 RepID=A0A1M5Y4H0_9FIRM|nr:hypothetical protein [Sporobacter termitidis]SHI06961.1 hypothetical protein SAMN02745823_02221 [Sporobacter termitidis DSM 10068]